jgi:putative aldouronate transport system permease protein
MRKKQKSKGEKTFEILNCSFLTLLALVCILPFINVLATSFATPAEVLSKKFILFPTTFTLDAYKFILSTPTVFRSIGVSVGITVIGTLLSMIVTSLMAYALSRRYLIGRGVINFMVVSTMLFSGGMIPSFLVVKNLGLINSYWALILPGCVSAMNMIIMRNFFQALPTSLEESAKIDGASDLTVFIKIMLPLALPSIATISLFYAVGYWNSFQNAIMYIVDSKKWPLQVLLRQIVIMSSGIESNPSAADIQPPASSIKMAVIVLGTVPMLMVYPFIQKYFVKGALMGSVKG